MKNLHKHRAEEDSFRNTREQPRYLKNKHVEVSKPLGKKYELIECNKQYRGEKLYQIRALRDFDTIIVGTLGGYVSGEHNLSHFGNCWVSHNAIACNQSHVSGNGMALHDSILKERANLMDNGCIAKNVILQGECIVKGTIHISGCVVVGGKKILRGEFSFDNNTALSAHFHNELEKRRDREGVNLHAK